MAGIDRFEDIVAWQKARELVREIYSASGQGRFVRDFGLRDQIQRAAGSIMHNIAEGFESVSSVTPDVRLLKCNHSYTSPWTRAISIESNFTTYMTWPNNAKSS